MINDAEIETALYLGKGKSLFRKIAHLWKAILVGHPFTDGNKRTALMIALTISKSCNIELDSKRKENLTLEITKIAIENIIDIKRIERLVRYAISGD